MQQVGFWFKSKNKALVGCFAMLAVLLSFLCLAQLGPASADSTTQSEPAASLTIKVGYTSETNPTNTYTTVRTFTYEEMAAMANLQQAYSYIDSMPAPVIDAAKGVLISDLLAAAGVNTGAGMSNVNKIYFYCTDTAPNWYTNMTRDYLFGTPRYYYPNIVKSWNPDTQKPDQSGAWGSPTDGAVQVYPMLAVEDNWARFQDPPNFNNMSSATRFRLLNGQTESDYTNGVYTAPKAAKWVCEIDVMLKQASPPALTANAAALGQPATLNFTDDTAWRAAITDITVSGVSIAGQYSVTAGAITINAGVFTAAGDYPVVVKATGYADATVTQTMDAAPGVLTPPVLTADSTDNTVGHDVNLSFTDDAAWRAAISSVSVDGNAVDSSKYTIDAGSIIIDQSVFTTAKDYAIVISATGYSDASVTQTMNGASTNVWDGSVDVSWYNTTDTVFYINTPAQLAGLAAIVNGTYNTGATVIGNPSYIVCNVGGGSVKDATANTWIYGSDDFGGKTVCLTADLDMGGVYNASGDSWSGPNYMPIGGQYCMTYQDGTTLIGSSWNGTLDGQGHTVKNIYCSRHGGSLGYGFSQSIGLIGRMGVHDNDPGAWYASPSVKNVAVTGYIYGNRSIGGIVGKNGKSNGSVIENCINYASVSNTDSKGCGGIAGAGWNNLTIKNCANLGSIYTSYKNAGGISGSCEAKVYNSYNVGYVGASSANQAQSLGTNNGGAVWTNCYWLDGSSASNQAVYGSTTGSTITMMPTTDSMKTADFLTALNAGGRTWVADTNNINNGYPIPRAFTADTSTLTDISKESDPTKLSYVAGQTFDAAGLVIWANYSDGTREKITDYTISKTTALEATDTTITVSGAYGGMAYSYDFTITVAAAPSKNGDVYELSTADHMLWFANQVNAGLNNAVSGKLMNDIDLSGVTWTPIGISSTTNYGGTFDGDGKTITLTIDKAGSNYIGLFGYVLDGTVKNLTVAGNISGGTYTAGIAGYVKDAATIENCVNNATITSTSNNVGGIAGYVRGATLITGCTNNGDVTGTYNVGGIAGIVYGADTISKCANTGAVTATSTSTSSYSVGGVVGHAYGGSTIDQCYNTGAVKGGVMNVGGVAGYRRDASDTLTNCYNTGSVTSESTSDTAHTGGVVGYTNDAACTVQNCYNAGAITVSNTGAFTAGVIGYATGNTNVSNNYYLNSTAAKGLGYATDNNNTVSKTSDELKALASTLGENFKAGSVYPILVWQGTTAPETYTVAVDGSISGGTVTVEPASGTEGTTITVTVTPDSGKRLVAGSLKYNGGSGDIEITATEGVYSFAMPAADVVVTAQFEDLPADSAPQYTVTPVEDVSVYEVGETGGIKTMTVKAGVIGLKYFGAQLTPVTAHEGKEVVVFVHLRDGVQLSLNVTKADFDFVNMAQAGFNVAAGDIVKVFIVDNLTNNIDFNPTLLQ
ncbi:The GLUG motif protein [Pelotomaculum sp. FP]|uniref:beta strand repeat-containing protein n=1 Tax=Pelotomaculum sp. FP TaxID=261474 RepID=UPI001064FF18|nr:hemoblobin-interacting domain-containing protein [Pelotomaculum sp. FP]TEB16966.1 The GLUG motif protein [Pelotomaculum sp. FP]